MKKQKILGQSSFNTEKIIGGSKRVKRATVAWLLCGAITLSSVPVYAGSSITWTGATEITSETTTSNQTYSSVTSGQNAILINTDDAVKLTSPTVTKSGGTNAGDDESFYGINSAVMCKGGGTTTITGATVTTSAAGANGVFSYGGNASTNATSGDGTTVVISNSKITTTGNGSGGIMTTGQGITKATSLTVNTSGDSSAAIRSDRGGGTVTVSGGTYKTSGTGSPAVYATATITVKSATLTSTASQGIVNEGGNKVVLNNCTVNAANKTLGSQDNFKNGVFLYQSMSGDASDGASVFKMTGGTLNNTYGHVFHVTNTSAAITLNDVDINNSDSSGVLLSVCDDAWSGLSNVATLNAVDQTLEGTVLVGSDSTANIKLSGTSTWTGSTSGKIKSHRDSSTISSSLGTVKVTMSDSAVWVLDADSTVSSIKGTGKINYNGHTLTVGSTEYTSGSPGVSTITETSSGSTSSSSSTTTDSTTSSSSTVTKGKTYKVSGQYYKVTKVASGSTAGKVTFVKAKNAKKVTVPATVKLKDSKKYKVTVVGAKAFKAKKIRTVTIGSNVSKLTKYAFKSSKATKIILKTKKLTKSNVKYSLKSSKIKTVQVKVGTTKLNKKYVKKYKKIFTKKNAGKSVTVK
ncbi:MAG: hypothetical protein K6E13_11490 [Lachnospiraceae bacterium]|nr:hypothetical protein [Lachnospiraceae bacterium]